MSSDANEPVYNGYFDMSGSMNDGPSAKISKQESQLLDTVRFVVPPAAEDFTPAANEEIVLLLYKIAEVHTGEVKELNPFFEIPHSLTSPWETA